MTKLIPLQSIEHGIRRAFALLGDKGVERAITDYLGEPKSASLIRKCADPDDDRHHLQMRYAVALDRACNACARQSPLLESFTHLSRISDPAAPGSESDAGGDIYLEVVGLQAALGDLAHRITEATAAASDLADVISKREQHNIFRAIDVLEHQTQLFKSLISER